MTKWTTWVACLSVAAVCWAGCKEAMVGAPCVPETDRGEFNTEFLKEIYSIETRSVQCETRICLTKTEKTLPDSAPDKNCANCMAEALENETASDHCYDLCEGLQMKFSFCSCRCADVDGNTFQTNPDKYDYLCECPPDTSCHQVMGDIEGAPDKVKGSYCIPNCILDRVTECPDGICVPSKDSSEPWKWYCEN